MASKENVYRTIRNLTVAGAVVASGCRAAEQKDHREGVEAVPPVRLVLGQDEVEQLNRIENFISAYADNSQVVEESTELVLDNEPEFTLSVAPTMPVELMTEAGARLVESYRAELPAVIEDIGASGQDVEDLNIYYPIYRAGQDRYGVPWYLIWIVHQEESTVSINPEALDGPIHYGAMQRALEFHKEENVAYTNRGLEFLGALPTRRFDDAREIIWASAALSEWAGEGKDYRRALHRYSAAVHAENRWQKYLSLKVNVED